jgi:hypothetical protein
MIEKINGVSATAECVRAGIGMTADEWFSVPPEVRARYWKETDWGKQSAGASPEVVKLIVQHVGRRRPSAA